MVTKYKPFQVPRSAKLLGQWVIMSGTFIDNNLLFNSAIYNSKNAKRV